MPQELYTNLITFDWPTESTTIYFSLNKEKYSRRLYKNSFPNNLATIFPQVNNTETEFVYTFFGQPKENFSPLSIDLKSTNPEFVKHYYRDTLQYYFRKKENQIVHYGFIDELEVYVPAKEAAQKGTKEYHVFALRIQLLEKENIPALLLSYEGKSTVMTASVAEILKSVPHEDINYVLFQNQILKYNDVLKGKPDLNRCYPVLGNRLRKALKIRFPSKSTGFKKENKYDSYNKLIQHFFKTFLNKPEFRKYISIHSGFYKVPQESIGKVKEESNELRFKKRTSTNPKEIRNLGPFEGVEDKKVNVIFVYHKSDEAKKNELKGYFQNGLKFYKGLYNYAKVNAFFDDTASMVFENKLNPIPELETKYKSYSYDKEGITNLAIYLTPFSKEETAQQRPRVYPMVKGFLLNKGIVCQSVRPSIIDDNNFVYSITTLSVAILAKLGGIPWRLNQEVTDELIVGVGAFKSPVDDVRYVGSAISFDNAGSFDEIGYFQQQDIDLLAGQISKKVREFAAKKKEPTRLIIHFYKKLNNKELLSIERELQKLELPKPIPIFIVSINKTESTDIVAFDMAYPQLIPISGTYIDIGNHKYLLFNNARSATAFDPKDGYHFPVKLAIDCNKKELLDNDQTIQELINQVYQFSRMYWKSLSQQNLPVTIKYPEMVAEIAPHIAGGLPDFASNKLWFL